MGKRFDLEERVAIVAGGAGLIGSAVAAGFVDQGCTVVVADIDDDRGEQIASELGADAIYRRVDLTDSDETDDLVDLVTEMHGRLDILVNVAYPTAEQYGRPFEQVTIGGWRQNVIGHLDSFFLPIKSAAPAMIEKGRGSIINFASIYGVQAPDFTLYEGTDIKNPVEYAVVKGGIINLTRYLASYLAGSGIRVNAISPGGVYDEQDPEFVERYERRTPLGRMADPEDTVGAAIFLASSASSYVTGHNLVVDGGWTIS